MFDPFRTSVPDKLLQQNTALTDAELDIIRRLQNAENPDENYDPYAPTVEWYTSKEEVMPLSGRAEPKARFVASKWEHKKVSFDPGFPLPLCGVDLMLIVASRSHLLFSLGDENRSSHPIGSDRAQ